MPILNGLVAPVMIADLWFDPKLAKACSRNVRHGVLRFKLRGATEIGDGVRAAIDQLIKVGVRVESADIARLVL